MTTLDRHILTASIRGTSFVLKPTKATITLDESWSPYAQAELVCVLPDPAGQAVLDLREKTVRIELQARQTFGKSWALSNLTTDYGGSLAALTIAHGGKTLASFYKKYSRPWNSFGRRLATSRRLSLVATRRVFDHTTNELRISAASGEVLLQRHTLIDATPLDPATTSVRDIAELLLGRIGETLTAGTDDATVEYDSTLWQPGVKAWDYIAPLLQASNLKLWCDERGFWFLTVVQPLADGTLILTPDDTITELTDTMETSGDEWFDAVVVIYTWTDALGENQTAYDIAGDEDSQNARTFEYDGIPYPGAGAAAGILNRAKGRGRVIQTRAISNYTVQPGQSASIRPPDTDAQTGYVASVRFNFPENQMDIESRGLVDTPETAYLFGSAEITYVQVDPAVTYENFEWSTL